MKAQLNVQKKRATGLAKRSAFGTRVCAAISFAKVRRNNPYTILPCKKINSLHGIKKTLCDGIEPSTFW